MFSPHQYITRNGSPRTPIWTVLQLWSYPSCKYARFSFKALCSVVYSLLLWWIYIHVIRRVVLHVHSTLLTPVEIWEVVAPIYVYYNAVVCRFTIDQKKKKEVVDFHLFEHNMFWITSDNNEFIRAWVGSVYSICFLRPITLLHLYPAPTCTKWGIQWYISS